MNLEQLYYVVEIKKQGSLTKAANKFYISPAALSMSIKNLEQELSVILFHRTSKGMLPTENGAVIIQKFEHIIEELDEVTQFINDINQSHNWTVRILSSPLFTVTILPSILSTLAKESPNITLEIEDISYNAQERGLYALTTGCSDFVITATPLDNLLIDDLYSYANLHQFFIQPVCTCTLVAYVRANHPLADNKFITKKDLEQHTIVATKAFANHLPITNFKNLITVRNFECVERIIINDNHILLAPDLLSFQNPYIQSKQIRLINLAEENSFAKTVFFLAYSKASTLSIAHKKVLDIIMKYSQ